MDIKPLTPVMGAEVWNTPLQSLDTPEKQRKFISLVHEHQVVVAKRQEMTPQEMVACGKWLGKNIDYGYPVEYRLPDYPEIFVISNLKRDGKQIGSTTNGMGWHTDGIYMPIPVTFTMLYTIEGPQFGGETVFASMYAAYESLTEDMRSKIEHLSCIHSYEHNYKRRRNAPEMTQEMKERFPDIRQPLVRPHPVTGRKGLYLTASTLVGVEGPDGPVDRRLVDDLIEYATNERFVYRHHAEPGDFIIWDNAGTMHTATPYDTSKERRLVYRIMTTE